MKNIKLSVLSLTVFAATLAQASDPAVSVNANEADAKIQNMSAEVNNLTIKVSDPSKVKVEASHTSLGDKAKEIGAVLKEKADEVKETLGDVAHEAKDKAKDIAHGVKAHLKHDAKEVKVDGGFFASLKAYAKNTVSFVKGHPVLTVGAIVATWGVLAYRKEILAGAQKAYTRIKNFVVNNPVPSAVAAVAAVAAVGYAYRTGQLNCVTGFFNGTHAVKVEKSVGPAIVKTEEIKVS
jgi:ElaB/YqjD/DUF883 family membrane-anchored ribosome-binding protein